VKVDAAHDTRKQLGQLMVDEGFITVDQLTHALAQQRASGRPLGTILVELGFVSAGAVSNALAEQHGGLLKTEFGISAGLHAIPGGEPGSSAATPSGDLHASRSEALETQLHAVLTERNALAQKVNEQAVQLGEVTRAKDTEVERVTNAASAHIAGLEAKHAETQRAEVARVTDAAAAHIATLEAEFQAALAARDARVSELERELAELRRHAGNGPDEDAESEAPLEPTHLLFPSPDGYVLAEWSGPAPESGTMLDVDGARFAVTRIGVSPFPGSRLRCVFVEPV
jgi:hypothetical protein